MYHLAQSYTDQLRYAEADTLFLELIAIQQRTLEPDHPQILRTRSAMGWNHRLAGRYDEAERLTAAALADMRRILGDDHPETLIAVNNLAVIYKDLERYAEAEPLYLENLESGTRILETHPENLPALVNLGSFYMAQDRWEEAHALADRAVDTFTGIMPAGHVGIAFARMTRGLSSLELGRLREAEIDLMAANDALRPIFPPDHRHLMNIRTKLALICDEQGRGEDAQRWRRLIAEGEGAAEP